VLGLPLFLDEDRVVGSGSGVLVDFLVFCAILELDFLVESGGGVVDVALAFTGGLPLLRFRTSVLNKRW